MAGKLLKENIPVERAIGQGGAQAAAETSVMLTGGDRNVTIVSVRALPVVTTTEVQTGGVAVQGTVEFTALYLTDIGELRSRDAQTGFTAVIQIADAAPKMRAKVLATVTGAQATEKDGRLDLGAEMQLEGFVSQNVTETLATAVQAPVRMAEKPAVLASSNEVVRATERENFAENFPLDNDAFTRVALFAGRAEIENVQTSDGQVLVTGQVTVDSLLAGADAAAPVGWQTETIPFSEEIEDDGFKYGMQTSVTARVQDLKSEVVFNQDGDEQEGNLRIEYVLELTAEARTVIETSVLADVYPLTEDPFTAVTAEVSYISGDTQMAQTQTLTAEIELPADAPPMVDLVGAFASPVALDTVGDETAHAEGLMRVTLLYRTGGEVPLAVYSHEAPFALDFDAIDGAAEVSGVEMGKATAEKLSAMQAQVRVPLTLKAEKIDSATTAVLSDLSDEGEAAALPVGAVLYYPQEGETLWDVARRYRTTEESLKKRNPEGKSPVLVYRRLTEF